MVTPLRTILNAVAKTYRLEPAAHLATARAAWPDVAGGALAAASVPLRLRDRILTVGVTHPLAGQEVLLRQDQIVRALAARLGDGVIEKVVTTPRRSLAAPGRQARRRR